VVARSPPVIRRSDDRSIFTEGTKEKAGWHRATPRWRMLSDSAGRRGAGDLADVVGFFKGGGAPVVLGDDGRLLQNW
jgi:hypothetical protein